MAAATTLAGQVSRPIWRKAACIRRCQRVRDVSAQIAAAVATIAFAEGLAGVPEPSDLLAFVRSQMYEPRYADLCRELNGAKQG